MAGSNFSTEQLRRWRLVLGKDSEDPLNRASRGFGCSLFRTDAEMDEGLAAIFDPTEGEAAAGQRSAGLEKSSPRLAKWLGDIRSYFREDVVAVIQQDAIERKGLKQLLFEPEMLKNVQPNVQLVGTLMSLSGRIPERT